MEGSRRVKLLDEYKPRTEWLHVRHAANKPLTKVVDKEQAFNIHRHFYTPRGITNELKFKEHGGEISLVPQQACSMKA